MPNWKNFSTLSSWGISWFWLINSNCSAACCSSFAFCATRIRTENEKLLPLPFSLSRWTLPCINSINCFVIASPNPVPPYFLVIEASTCEKLLNNLSFSSGEIPIPVSDTTKNSSISSSNWSVFVTSILMYPTLVNFTAFDKKLFNICVRRNSSPIKYFGIVLSILTIMRNPLALIVGIFVSTAWLTIL